MAETAPPETLAPPAKHPGRPFKGQEKINIPEAFKLRLRGWTFEQIAQKYGCNQSSVIRSLDSLVNLVPNPELREAYQQSKADVLESVQLTMMASLLHPAKIEKATLGNVAYAASKLDEMIRLERGQSTKNVNVLSTIIDGAHSKLFPSTPQPVVSDLVENTDVVDISAIAMADKK